MLSPAKYYFEIPSFRARGKMVELRAPVFAATVGVGTTWASGSIQTRGDFKAAFERINPQAPLYIVLPGIFVSEFPKGLNIDELRLIGFAAGDKSHLGVLRLVLHNADVAEIILGVRADSLPGIPERQKMAVREKLPGDAWYRGLVKVGISAADIVVAID